MKEYFKYCSVEELKDQIRNRLAAAKLKIGQMKETLRTHQSLDSKFCDYVSELKNKQRDYDAILGESTELNSLLRKRRSRINESLQRYERSKCKTVADFAPAHTPSQFKHQHTLLQTLKHLPQPRSFTQANFFTIAPTDNSCLTQIGNKTLESEGRRLRSITKVVNITVSHAEHSHSKHIKEPFTFAKNSSNSIMQPAHTNEAKKALRFETAPAQSNIKQNSKKGVMQPCIKKIKARISSNHEQCKQAKVTTKELTAAYEEQFMRRNRLKQLILASQRPSAHPPSD